MKVLKWVNEHLEEYICCILLAIIAIVMMAQIIMRYIFGSAFFWAEELSRYCYIWIVFLSAGFCIQKDNELRVDIIVDQLPRIPRGILRIASQIIIIVFYALMAYHSCSVVASLYETMRQSAALGIPMYVMYSSCVIGFSLGVLRGIQKLYIKRREWFVKPLKAANITELPLEAEKMGGRIV